jgi:hypothetical protein
MQIIPLIKEIIANKPDNEQLNMFVADIRDSLTMSNQQFISLAALAITALVTYHLVVYENASGVTLNSIQISNTTLFRRVFLIVPSALLCAMSCVGYLRRWQREVYDYLTISNCSILGKTGLHELRLPADYILGLFVLGQRGGTIGKFISNALAYLLVVVFVLAPAAYIVRSAAENIIIFGVFDLISFLASIIAIILSVSSIIIMMLAGRIRP